jgi:hypothetical protein
MIFKCDLTLLEDALITQGTNVPVLQEGYGTKGQSEQKCKFIR